MKLTGLWVAAAFAAAVPSAAQAGNCTTMSGAAFGVTRGFAEYESMINILVTTGNWPIAFDRVGRPRHSCRHDGWMWTCRAVAKVCKS